ncbi:hypothetical protein CO683_05480 [Bradyrhizobium ottawaense]|nr:hypothetical protein CO683_05480 [Bradyrhizobium ottawaense]
MDGWQGGRRITARTGCGSRCCRSRPQTTAHDERSFTLKFRLRHGRACPGHPRSSVRHQERGCPGHRRAKRPSFRRLCPGMTRLWNERISLSTTNQEGQPAWDTTSS